jgi:hypothetical protein
MSDEARLPCEVKLPPATTIRAGCKLSTLIEALAARGMTRTEPSTVTDEGLVERLEATIHQINGHWWNRRKRPDARDIRAAIDRLAALSRPLV